MTDYPNPFETDTDQQTDTDTCTSTTDRQETDPVADYPFYVFTPDDGGHAGPTVPNPAHDDNDCVLAFGPSVYVIELPACRDYTWRATCPRLEHNNHPSVYLQPGDVRELVEYAESDADEYFETTNGVIHDPDRGYLTTQRLVSHPEVRGISMGPMDIRVLGVLLDTDSSEGGA